MPAPFNFPSNTNNFDLPFLFSGQAQKEFFVNQSLVLIDALLPRVVIASTDAPPSNASDGDAYVVISGASGEWSGEDNAIAVQIGGAWHFSAPIEGMEVFDQSAGQTLIYRNQWESAVAPDAATGGSVVDSEARSVINQLIHELTRVGILA